jgi:hypothetical protein
MHVTAVVTHEAPFYVARCVELDVASQGGSVDEALANLKDAVAPPFAAVGRLSDEPPVVATFEVEGAAAAPPPPVAATLLVDRLRAGGWSERLSGRHLHFVCPDGEHQITLPVADRIADGVYRMVVATADLHERGRSAGNAVTVLARIDAVFGRHPDAGDATGVIRAERDAV